MADSLGILVPDFVLHMLDDLEDIADSLLKHFVRSFFFVDHHLPVPLVNIDGVQIVHQLIAADRIHIGIQAFMKIEAVFFQRISFPFGE